MIATREVTLEDGGVLIETYSDDYHYIRQTETGNIYDRAMDPIAWPRTYEETEDIIPEDERYIPDDTPSEPSADTILNIILGESQ